SLSAYSTYIAYTTRFRSILHHEKGRKACAPTRVPLRFSTAAWKIEDFNLLLKERLQHCVLQQAAIKLEILADAPQPRAPANDTLDRKSTRLNYSHVRTSD